MILRRVFKEIWPNLPVHTVSSPRKQQHSDDYGVYMTINVITDYPKVKIA